MALSLSYVGWHTHTALAKGGGGDDSGGDDDDGGDDDGGGGDKPDKGGGDDDDDDDQGSDQPPVTSGGLFTIKTYPVRENSRPLTMTKGITQLRLGLGTDLSAKGAFKSIGVNVEGQYGYSDNFTLIGGMTDAYNFQNFGFYAGFEGSLVYDVLDIRVAANVHRNALPEYKNFCSPAATNDPADTLGPGTDVNTGAMYDKVSSLVDPKTCKATNASIINLPDGTYTHGGTQFSIDIGFPFRYAFRPEIAVVALQTLMSIDFNQVNDDHYISDVISVGLPDGTMANTTVNTPTTNKVTPDLKPSIGLATNPIPQLSIVLYAQLRIPDFDTQAGAFQVPVTGRIEASPSQQLDFGLEFTLLNVNTAAAQSPTDNRFLSLFMQARY
jgi:hypothetical protein